MLVCKRCSHDMDKCTCPPKPVVFGLTQCATCGVFMASGATCNNCKTDNNFHQTNLKPCDPVWQCGVDYEPIINPV